MNGHDTQPRAYAIMNHAPALERFIGNHESAPSEARRTIAESIGQSYAAAPTRDRIRILEALLRPMGIVALMGIGCGLFARIKSRNAAWQPFALHAEDIRSVLADDVVALAERVLQSDPELACRALNDHFDVTHHALATNAPTPVASAPAH
jgi:hypothetical protein